jgi:benzylsuccinate CoA-transferase BbsF subunit
VTSAAQALDGLKVVCFGGYAAGPHIGKVLANYGALAIHVESYQRPDGFRLQYPPFAGGIPGINRGGCFSYFNDSKYSVSIDLKNAAGEVLARRLAVWADIVVENMRPGAMERLGLAFAELSRANPRLVMLSTCNMGQTGPRSDQPGFGSQLSAMGGMCEVTGFPDGPPMLLYGPYIDFIASALGGAAVLAGLLRSRRTGKGAWLDLSQYECGVMFMAGALQDHFATGAIARRCGNDDPGAAPHGAYRSRDGEWVALSCWSDAEFTAFAGALGAPALARDRRFATLAARQSNKTALDPIVSAWTASRSAIESAELLQAAGVASYPVVTVAGLFGDPQLLARGQWRVRRHPEIGDQAYCFPGFDLVDAPGDIVSAAPCLGVDTNYVFRDLIGLTQTEVDSYRAAGAFGRA